MDDMKLFEKGKVAHIGDDKRQLMTTAMAAIRPSEKEGVFPRRVRRRPFSRMPLRRPCIIWENGDRALNNLGQKAFNGDALHRCGKAQTAEPQFMSYNGGMAN